MAASADECLAAGRRALQDHAWRDALARFREAASLGAGPEALEGLGVAAFYLGDESVVFDARERAYRLYLERGDRVSAARVAMALATDSVEFRGQPAVAWGWLSRARRLLEGQDLTPEHAWLLVWEAHLALMLENNAGRARAGAARSTSVADRAMRRT